MSANVAQMEQAPAAKEATREANTKAKTSRRGWKLADTFAKQLGGILTAAAVAWLGFHASSTLDRRQAADTNTRLYAELMSQREDAETSLRKDMFNSIIGSFLSPKANGDEQQVLNLELLAYNFHEALDLGPLFKHVYSKISESQKPNKECLNRLEKAASEVKSKQIAALEEAGGKLDATIDFDELAKSPGGLTVVDRPLPINPAIAKTIDPNLRDTHFKVQARFVDRKRREIGVLLEVRTPNNKLAKVSKDEANYLHSTLLITPFDFPMIDNTRLSHGQRCAIVVRRFGNSSAEITLVYFPGSRASLKEKPFYDEVIYELLYAKKALGD